MHQFMPCLMRLILPILQLALIALPLAVAVIVPKEGSDSFHESLTLNPLPDGKVSVLFEFTTYFTRHISGQHNALTPPSLLLPLHNNNVSELTVSFVAGQWDQVRSGEAGPLQYESGGGGGEVRGWLRGGHDGSKRWTVVTHALGGLFCAGLGDGGDITTFGDIYPAHRPSPDLVHHLIPLPNLHLCTENLTPFLSLLPSKGLSGLSTLLAQPGIVFSWGFKTEGIEVIMPIGNQPGRWTGWWEGVVDLVPQRGRGVHAFSLGSLFKRGVPKAFPEAASSTLRIVKKAGMKVEPDPARDVMVDHREAYEWDLLDPEMQHKDIRGSWEGVFEFPHHFTPPPVTLHRTITSAQASDGIFKTTIRNHGDTRHATYSEAWPWWVKGWMSEMAIKVDGIDHPFGDVHYHPSVPPTDSTTTLHIRLILPANSTTVITIPFTKLMLKYTEHNPDAERGREIPSGVLTLDEDDTTDPRRRIYTKRLLLDVPTPDFSMPYNVIIMSSTVMAVFFGLMQGSLTRRWGWVQVPESEAVSEVKM